MKYRVLEMWWGGDGKAEASVKLKGITEEMLGTDEAKIKKNHFKADAKPKAKQQSLRVSDTTNT